MALENISTSSLRNAITSCKNAINYNTDKQVLNAISNTAAWKSDSSNTLKTAINTLINQRYKKLEEKLTSYYKIVSYIEKYQDLYEENKTYKFKQNELDRKIINNRYIMNDDNRERLKSDERAMQSKIYDLNRKISNNTNQMSEIKRKISSLI